MFKKLIKKLAFKTGKLKSLYIRFCRPSCFEYAESQQKSGGYHNIGKHCANWPYTNVTNPEYISLGNNVMLRACIVLGHYGSITVLKPTYDKTCSSS